MGTVIVMFAFAAVFFGLFLYSMTEKAQARRAKYLQDQEADKDAQRRAQVAAKTLTGPGWSLKVASLDSVNLTARVIATTAATITNTSNRPARFRVSLVLADADNTRLGTITALSDELAPHESQLLTLRGTISPLTTKKFGRMNYQVENW